MPGEIYAYKAHIQHHKISNQQLIKLPLRLGYYHSHSRLLAVTARSPLFFVS